MPKPSALEQLAAEQAAKRGAGANDNPIVRYVTNAAKGLDQLRARAAQAVAPAAGAAAGAAMPAARAEAMRKRAAAAKPEPNEAMYKILDNRVAWHKQTNNVPVNTDAGIYSVQALKPEVQQYYENKIKGLKKGFLIGVSLRDLSPEELEAIRPALNEGYFTQLQESRKRAEQSAAAPQGVVQ